MIADLLLVAFAGGLVVLFTYSPGKKKSTADIQNGSAKKLAGRINLAKSQNGNNLSMDEDPKKEDQNHIEELISERRMERKERSAGFCSKCGRPVQQSDIYCPGCGEKIN
jgi:hypothetical protein